MKQTTPTQVKNAKMAGGLVAAISAICALQLACAAIFLSSFCKSPILQLAGIILLLPTLLQLILLLPRCSAGKAVSPLEEDAGKKARVKHFFAKLGQGLQNGYHKIRTGLVLLLIGFASLGCHMAFWFPEPIRIESLGYYVPVIFGILFALSVVLEKWCTHTAQEETSYTAAVLKGLSGGLYIFRWVCIVVIATTMLKLLSIYDASKIAKVILQVLFVYESAMLAFCVVVRVVRKEMDTKPELLVSLQGMGKDKNILSYLEENTGITMRSLWSMQLIKKVLPLALFGIVVILWLSTGVVLIQTNQEGALYRFGKMQEKTLKPGIHLTLPAPLDQVDVYDTKSIQKMAIGYIPKGDQDNLWTLAHGAEEYRLLLGGGEEIVSINLMVQYRIKDLPTYVKSLASPESLLQARAYEIITQRTISTDLDTLLSTDREAFSESFRKELEEKLDTYETGLEIVDIVLESIHPPVEISAIFQDIISAELEGKEKIIAAQSTAQVRQTTAEIEKLQAIASAQIAYENQVGDATAAVSEFMASVKADGSNRDAYRYYKYISAMTQSYKDAKLIIVGDGVDSKNLYIGSLTVPAE